MTIELDDKELEMIKEALWHYGLVNLRKKQAYELVEKIKREQAKLGR